MSFFGRNYDVFSGASAPVMAIVCFKDGKIARPKLLLGWNILCFLILLNTAVTAMLSIPTPFQVFRDSPPNTVVAGYPYVLLPGFVVPFALLSHVISAHQALAEIRSRSALK